MTSPKRSPPPKRSIDQVDQAEDDVTKTEAEDIDNEGKEGDSADVNPKGKAEPAPKKRKASARPKETTHNPTKATAKRATRSSAKSRSSKHEPKAVIQFLLSDEAISMLDQLETDDSNDFQFPRDR